MKGGNGKYRNPDQSFYNFLEDTKDLAGADLIARVLVNRIKTGVEHIIPCHSEFKPILLYLNNRPFRYISPFLFTCPSSRQEARIDGAQSGAVRAVAG